jgi:VWFA-related protein
MTRTTRAAAALVLGVLATVAAGAAQQPQRPPVFRAGIERVRVDVLVTDAGKPIQGLTAADFQLEDNGVVQDVELATTAGHVSVALVLDLSGSVEQEGIDDLKRACQALVDALEPADRAWLITFADAFALEAGPGQDRATLRRALDALRPGGGTSMWDAMFAALSLVSGTEGRSLVLAFTDGMDTTSWLDEPRALETFKRAEVVIDVVRPRGTVASPAPVEAAARATGGAVMFAEKSARMADQFVDLLRQFRLGYVLTYAPTTTARADGWHKLEIKLKNRKGRVQARQGYFER